MTQTSSAQSTHNSDESETARSETELSPETADTRSPAQTYQDDGWLRKQYHEKNSTQQEIASMVGVTQETISYWLNNHEIETRSRGSLDDTAEQLTNRSQLFTRYVQEENTLAEIAVDCDVSISTVSYWLNKHEIETRSPTRNQSRDYHNEQWLREHYVQKHKTIAEVAEACGASPTTIATWIHKHEIETRTRGPSQHTNSETG